MKFFDKHKNAIAGILLVFALGFAAGYTWSYHHNKQFEKSLKAKGIKQAF